MYFVSRKRRIVKGYFEDFVSLRSGVPTILYGGYNPIFGHLFCIYIYI